MKHKKINSIVLGKYIITIFGTLGLLTLVGCIFYAGMWIRSAKTSIRTLRRNELGAVSDTIDQELSSAASILDYLSDHAQIIEGVIAPKPANNEQAASIHSILGGTVRDHSQIDALFLYPVGTETVYSGEEDMVSLQASRYGDLITRYLEERPSYNPGEKKQTRVLFENRYVFVCTDFFYSGDRPLGLLGAQISPSVFNSTNALVNGAHASLEIFSPLGETLFTRNASFLNEEARDVMTFEAADTHGMRFVYRFRDTLFGTKTGIYLLLGFLALAGILLLEYFLARQLGRRLHEPLDSIVTSFRTEDGGQSFERINEYEFLKQYLINNRDQYARASQVLERYRPRILETITLRLMDGAIDVEEASRTLQISGSAWNMEAVGICQAVCCCTQKGEPVIGLEYEIILHELRKGLADINHDLKTEWILVSHEGMYFLTGCGMDPQKKQTQIFFNRWQALLQKTAGNYRMRILQGETAWAEKMSELKRVSETALISLEKSLYYQKSRDQKPQEAEEGENAGIAESGAWIPGDELRLRMEHVCRDLDHARSEAAIERIYDLIREEKVSGGKAVYEEASYIRSVLMEYLIEHHANIDRVSGLGGIDPSDPPASLQAFADEAKLRLQEMEQRADNVACSKMLQIIRERYMDSGLSLGMIADELHMSQSYLSALFSREQGNGFTDYVNQYRIHKAKQLMDTTDILVKDVGYKVGFNSAQNFNRVFKRYEGITPGQYKKSGRESVK